MVQEGCLVLISCLRLGVPAQGVHGKEESMKASFTPGQEGHRARSFLASCWILSGGITVCPRTTWVLWAKKRGQVSSVENQWTPGRRGGEVGESDRKLQG